jgi:hypothetical protein
MLSPFDDFPIHPSADPIAQTASGDVNHYDRYFFNGHHQDGDFFFGAAMGHYPNRAVIDGAFSLAIDGVQHSFFASGRMPLDRATAIGPLRIEILEPLRKLRYVIEPNEEGIEVDLVYEGTTVTVEEPRQRKVGDDGILFTDHTRMTQWGTWSGVVRIDGNELRIDPGEVSGTKDRSWGVRPVGEQTPTNKPFQMPQIFWLWAPLHFGDRFTHLGLHEHTDGSRWFETALVLEPMPAGSEPWSTDGVRECRDIRYQVEWEPGRREMRSASLSFTDPVEGEAQIELERCFTFYMRGIGYNHPYWAHGRAHGALEIGRESIQLDDVDPADPTTIHIQTVVKARWGDRTGIGVLEQAAFGAHEPTGLTGLFDGYQA